MKGFGRLTSGIAYLAGRRPKTRLGMKSAVPTVVIVGGPETTADVESPDWHLAIAGDVAEAEELVDNREAAIVLCDRDSLSPAWKQAVSALARTKSRPSVILIASTADSCLWEQVTAAGAYELLRKPASPEALCRAIRAGIAHWQTAQALDAERAHLSFR